MIVEKSQFFKIRLIFNISENKEEFQDLRNILDKVKYLGTNLHILINSLFLTIFQIQFFANN